MAADATDTASMLRHHSQSSVRRFSVTGRDALGEAGRSVDHRGGRMLHGTRDGDLHDAPPARDALQALNGRRVEVYSTFFDKTIKRSLGARQITEHAFGVLDGADLLFVVQTSDNKSEGMLIEIGYCLAKKIPIIVATKDTVTKTYIPDIAAQSFRWGTLEDLTKVITDLKL